MSLRVCQVVCSSDRIRQFSHTSTRTLLGILRLSQALARLRMSNEVLQEDVIIALNLIKVSKSSLYDDNTNAGLDKTPTTAIYEIILGLKKNGSVEMRKIRDRVMGSGFTEDQLAVCIREYSDTNVWQVSAEGSKLEFIGFEGDEEESDYGDMDGDVEMGE